MKNNLDSLSDRLSGIRNPCTKGTLKAAISYGLDTINNPQENPAAVFSFLEKLSSFYHEGRKSLSPGEFRGRFRESGGVQGINDDSIHAIFQAMANSVIDSFADSGENHSEIGKFLSWFSRAYHERASGAGRMERRRKYRELSGSDKLYLFNKYQSSGLSRKEFADKYNLSSVYALDRVRKYNQVGETEYASISDILGGKGLRMAMGLIP